jgi:hypothetical protein
MSRLAEGGWVYSVADPSHAEHALVTLAVADLDLTVAQIGARGLHSALLETVADAGRKASFTNPDGNVLTFVEVARSGKLAPRNRTARPHSGPHGHLLNRTIRGYYRQLPLLDSAELRHRRHRRYQPGLRPNTGKARVRSDQRSGQAVTYLNA